VNIVDYINIIRLRWVRHIVRMEKERIPEKVLKRKFHKISRRNKKTMDGVSRGVDSVQRDG